jgi:hypothetical protein
VERAPAGSGPNQSPSDSMASSSGRTTLGMLPRRPLRITPDYVATRRGVGPSWRNHRRPFALPVPTRGQAQTVRLPCPLTLQGQDPRSRSHASALGGTGQRRGRGESSGIPTVSSRFALLADTLQGCLRASTQPPTVGEGAHVGGAWPSSSKLPKGVGWPAGGPRAEADVKPIGAPRRRSHRNRFAGRRSLLGTLTGSSSS